ncbi:helix-turn-helix domain-containing protein [Altibacter sp. HG106]|uniref:helix-turn-helix domain-containing protein n=1 Tax=Altibacter sp. HG106 TaxID=3023937 RepID=UPI002350371B|nr:helix-turn-helix domain-containing protein [Altibacter sp. HG106]MDC7993567.1 helix-turn-helix domain-containing protein [Altibacter sp. HG106]
MAQSASIVIDRIKAELSLTSDKALCKLLEIKANTLSTWKKRDTLDFNKVIALCNENQLNLNYIFFGEEDAGATTVSESKEEGALKKVIHPLKASKDVRKLKLINTNRNIIVFQTFDATHPSVAKGSVVVGQKIRKTKIKEETPYIIKFQNNMCLIDELCSCDENGNCYSLKYQNISELKEIEPERDISDIYQLVEALDEFPAASPSVVSGDQP